MATHRRPWRAGAAATLGGLAFASCESTLQYHGARSAAGGTEGLSVAAGAGGASGGASGASDPSQAGRDQPDYRYTISQGYVPALAAHGIAPTDTVYITVAQQIGAVADMSSAISSAVTKFRAEGIDHVIVQDGPAGVFGDSGLTLEWMNQAKSQGCYPRYGQNEHNVPGWSILPADQMDKAVAIDSTDYDAKYDQGWHANPARDLCFKLEADAGFPVQADNVNDEFTAASACDDVFLLQQVLNGLSTVSADAFVQAVSALGPSYQPALVYGSKFAGNRDGGGMVRTEDYSAACQCLTYRGAPFYGD